MQAGQRIGVSPEFDRRVSQQFPPGTPEVVLIDTMKSQGFQIAGTCKSDHSIKQTTFDSARTHAVLYWKADETKKIIWSKGFVSYRGL
jgi:hypothetical protein